MSIFSVSKGHQHEADDNFGNIDEQKLENALTSLAGEMEGVDEDDPRQAAHMMRRLFETTGLNPGSGMEEAINRMEAGEDPEKIENEMGDILEQEDPFAMASPQGLKTLRRRYLPPNVDETLYDLE